MTSISDFFAFVVGSTTSLPALRDFCAYAAIGILFDFLYQSTVFVAFLALDDERQEGGHVDMVPCVKREAASPLCGLSCFRDAAQKNAVDETSFRVVGRFTSSVLPRVVLSPAGKAVTLLLSLAILVVGAIGAVNVEMDFQVRWFTPDGAWMHDVYAVQDAHFAGENIPFAFYTKQVRPRACAAARPRARMATRAVMGCARPAGGLPGQHGVAEAVRRGDGRLARCAGRQRAVLVRQLRPVDRLVREVRGERGARRAGRRGRLLPVAPRVARHGQRPRIRPGHQVHGRGADGD